MDGFKNSTKTHYAKGGDVKGAKGAAKMAKVLGEFKRGELHSGSKGGPKVSSPKQAVAIAMSEARKAPMKKAGGGMVDGTSSRPTNSRGRPATNFELGIGDDDEGAVARGNRQPYERMPKDLASEIPPVPRSKPRSLTVERTVVSESPAPRTALDRKLSKLPSQKGEMGKGSFKREPLVNRMLGAVGLKKGGLAAMPRGKKGC